MEMSDVAYPEIFVLKQCFINVTMLIIWSMIHLLGHQSFLELNFPANFTKICLKEYSSDLLYDFLYKTDEQKDGQNRSSWEIFLTFSR